MSAQGSLVYKTKSSSGLISGYSPPTEIRPIIIVATTSTILNARVQIPTTATLFTV